MYDLDFGLLPTIVRHRVFRGLPNWIEGPLSEVQLPETLDRLRAASSFIGDVGPSKEDWLNRAYLRAGLSEFRSVREALRWDLSSGNVYYPGRSKNPLIHLVFRLRRLAVYVANAKTSEREVTATIRLMETDHSADIKILLIEDIEGYLRQEDLKDYRDSDITRICKWFEENQRIYGASQVLDTGILLYCQELEDVYSGRRASA